MYAVRYLAMGERGIVRITYRFTERKNINPPIIPAVIASSKSRSFGLRIFTDTYFLLLALKISRNIELKFNVDL